MKEIIYNIYIIDTSSLIEMKNKYPEDTFPTLWEKMNELYTNGRLIAPVEVKKEIEKGDDKLTEWIKDKKNMFIKPDKSQTNKVKEILSEFSYLAKPEKEGPNADPWLIALAIVKNNEEKTKIFSYEYVIVTEESRRNQRKIPAVAQHYNINCINLMELFRKEGWRF
ncbi:MAG: DUF4411 family protein [Aquificaceae bacterium]